MALSAEDAVCWLTESSSSTHMSTTTAFFSSGLRTPSIWNCLVLNQICISAVKPEVAPVGSSDRLGCLTMTLCETTEANSWAANFSEAVSASMDAQQVYTTVFCLMSVPPALSCAFVGLTTCTRWQSLPCSSFGLLPCSIPSRGIFYHPLVGCMSYTLAAQSSALTWLGISLRLSEDMG